MLRRGLGLLLVSSFCVCKIPKKEGSGYTWLESWRADGGGSRRRTAERSHSRHDSNSPSRPTFNNRYRASILSTIHESCAVPMPSLVVQSRKAGMVRMIIIIITCHYPKSVNQGCLGKSERSSGNQSDKEHPSDGGEECGLWDDIVFL